MHLRLMEASFAIVPAFFPFSHRHDSVRLRRQHVCVRSTSTSGAKGRNSLQSAVNRAVESNLFI